jgi:hypothetical protein
MSPEQRRPGKSKKEQKPQIGGSATSETQRSKTQEGLTGNQNNRETRRWEKRGEPGPGMKFTFKLVQERGGMKRMHSGSSFAKDVIHKKLQEE